jgi:hypothetical protein
MRRMVEATVGSKFITIVVLKDGYYQIEIAEEHRCKAAFELYEWCGMVMGFKNAPIIIMNKILGDMNTLMKLQLNSMIEW